MINEFALISFCNLPNPSASPVLCIKFPVDKDVPLTCAPVQLGHPEPISTATGIASMMDKIFVLFATRGYDYHVAALDRNTLEPLFYVDLPDVKEGHSILATETHLYIVSTGTDEVLAYKIVDDSLYDPEVYWKASDTKSDTHHVNSITEKNGEILISAFGQKANPLWSSATNGYIHNITRNVRVKEGIYHPHSLSVRNGKVYYSESHNNTFCSTDEDAIFKINGYTRGIAWLSDDQVCLASSIGRRVSKSTGLIANPDGPGEPAGECNFIVGNMESRELTTKHDLSWFGPETYDILMFDGNIEMLRLAVSAQLSERKIIHTQIGDLQSLTKQVAEGRAQVAESRAQVAESRAQVAEKERQILGIYNSRSWRWTAPLRKLTTFIRNENS